MTFLKGKISLASAESKCYILFQLGKKRRKRKPEMSETKDQSQTIDAQQALDSIQKMEKSAYRRATPPSWFGIAIALLTGSLVTLAVADMRQLQVFIILGIGMVISYQSQKSGVSIKTFPVKLLVIALILLVPLYFGMIIIGQLIIPSVGQTLAAVFAGIIFATVVFSLSLVERRIYLSKAASGQSK
jgi:hypothetical protein